MDESSDLVGIATSDAKHAHDENSSEATKKSPNFLKCAKSANHSFHIDDSQSFWSELDDTIFPNNGFREQFDEPPEKTKRISDMCIAGQSQSTPAEEEEKSQRQRIGSQELLSLLKMDEGAKSSVGSLAATELGLIEQEFNWDCGIACLQMVYRWLRNDPYDNDLIERERRERKELLRRVGTKSVWTIDLVVLLEWSMESEPILKKSLRSYLLCSKTLQVNLSLGSMLYYKEEFRRDAVRVNDLFREAKKRQYRMLCVRQLAFDQVVNLVSRPDCIAIVLLDNSILLGKSGTPYVGHYVVLWGVSSCPEHLRKSGSNTFCLVIKNPAVPSESNFVAPSLFEQAWRADGTDDDIIFVTK